MHLFAHPVEVIRYQRGEPFIAGESARTTVVDAAIFGPAGICVLTGDRDPKTTMDEAKAWARHTTGTFGLKVFAGGHFYLADRTGEVITLLDQASRARSMA